MNAAVKMAIVRFVRTVVPQLPAISAYIVGIKPEWAAALALAGAIVTAVDKYLREEEWY